MQLIDYVKNILRVNDPEYNPEIEMYIGAALDDLQFSGVLFNEDNKKSIMYAVAFFVKGSFGYENPDREGDLQIYYAKKLWLKLRSTAELYNIDIEKIDEINKELDLEKLKSAVEEHQKMLEDMQRGHTPITYKEMEILLK